MLGDIVKSCFKKAQEQQALPRIDVPFHSRYLWAGVLPFWACMLTFYYDKFPFSHLNPNLIAKPFDVSREYAQIIYDHWQTSSPKLDKVLKKWEQEKWASAKSRQKLAYTILIKLLAYQFTSPVRWIQTQDLLFTTFNFECLVELGPSPTLTGMATCTLKTKYETLDGSISQNHSSLPWQECQMIYYQYEDEIKPPQPSCLQ